MMPIYMDRHDVLGASAADLAIAHQKDLRVQTKYCCRALTYWFDETRGIAFCLVDAPDEEAVIRMHNEAHGMVPNRIIEVSTELVEAFLGRIGNPASRRVDNDELPVFEEPGLRTIMALEMKDVPFLNLRYGLETVRRLIGALSSVIDGAVRRHNGGVPTKSDGLLLATFASAVDAVACAKEIQSQLDTLPPRDPPLPALSVGIGLATGDPVTEGNDLFGVAIRRAKRISRIARDNHIIVASTAVAQSRRENPFEAIEGVGLIALSTSEEEFLDEVVEAVKRRGGDAEFQVRDLARGVGHSKSQLNRKLATLTGFSPKGLVREYRLRRASQLLATRSGNVTEVAFEMGFTSSAYFSKAFHDRFGVLPSAYLKVSSWIDKTSK